MLKPYPAARSAGPRHDCLMGAGRSRSTTRCRAHRGRPPARRDRRRHREPAAARRHRQEAELEPLTPRKRRHGSQGFDGGELPCGCQPRRSLALEACNPHVPCRKTVEDSNLRRARPSSPRLPGLSGSGRFGRFSTGLRGAGTLYTRPVQGLRESAPIVVVVRDEIPQ